jgi:hypothetical protein
MPRTRSRRHSSIRNRRRRTAQILAGMTILTVSLVAAAALLAPVFEVERAAPFQTFAESPSTAFPEAQLAPAAADGRPVYPYSIVDGGAATVEELKTAIDRDPVVALLSSTTICAFSVHWKIFLKQQGIQPCCSLRPRNCSMMMPLHRLIASSRI